MTNKTQRPGAHPFVALDVAMQIVPSLREAVMRLRKQDSDLARQIMRSASSIAANVAEGNRRVGGDRLHMFRIAAGSAAETHVHLHTAVSWGWLQSSEIELALALIDRELGLLWGLTRQRRTG